MKRWWVLKDRLRHGPFSEAELVEHVRSGRFTGTDFVTPEESQSVTQLSHRTLAEVLPQIPELNTLVAPAAVVTPPPAAAGQSPAPVAPTSDPLPKIRELLAKIEAIELVDSVEAAEATPINYRPVEHARSEDFLSSLLKIFQQAKPIFVALALLGAGYWFYDQGFESSEPTPVATSNQPMGPGRRPAGSTPLPANRQPSSAPQVKVPEKSERSISGYESSPAAGEPGRARRRTVSATRNEIPEDNSPTGVASRRERLRKLRSAMSPGNTAEAGSDPVAGIATDEGSEQEAYDDNRAIDARSIASEEEESEPYSEEGDEGESLPDESQDNDEDLEYQE